MKKTVASFLWPLIILLIGVLLTISGLRDQARRDEIEKSGVTLTGQVLGGKLERSGKSKAYYLRVAFQEGGVMREQRFGVTSGFFAQHVAGTSYHEEENRVTAPEVPVRTLPGRSGEAIIADGSTKFRGHYMGYFLIGLGLIFLIPNFLRSSAGSAPVQGVPLTPPQQPPSLP